MLYLQRYPHLNASKHYLKVVKLALNGLLNNPLGKKMDRSLYLSLIVLYPKHTFEFTSYKQFTNKINRYLQSESYRLPLIDNITDYYKMIERLLKKYQISNKLEKTSI